jgi:stage V sporulation protein B
MTTAGQEQARQAGRGGVAVLGAKVFFVLSGLAQQILLPRAIGLAGYGALARVLAFASILNNVVVASSVQGVSRVIARSLGHEREAFRSVFRVHVPLALVLALAFAGMAPAFAAFEGAPHIIVPLVVMALVVLLYGTYAPLVGVINGRGQFTAQARLDITFAVLRTIAMVAVGFLFVRHAWAGVTGATLGFAVAAACIVPLAMRVVFPLRTSVAGASTGALSMAGYLAELWPLAAAQLFTNLVMQVDITLVGHFLSSHDGSNVTAADEWVGVYRACELFAFLPYQLLLSITQILFPMLARARAEADPARVRLYVERGARLAAVACGMMVSVLVAIPASVIRFAYTADIAERGAHTLRILALGQGAFTMLAIATTILASLGRERKAAIVTFGAVVAVVTAVVTLTSRAAFGESQLEATAIGTSVGLALALVFAAFHVHKETGGFVPVLTAARILAALVVAGGLGSLLPSTARLLTPLAAIGIALVYLAVLVGTRELTRSDAHALRSLRGN